MRLSTGVCQVVLVVMASAILGACGSAAQENVPPPAPPPPQPTLSSAPVGITVSVSGGVVKIAATPMDVEIWWNAKTGQYGQVAWSLRYEGEVGRYVDQVEVRVKPSEAPGTKQLLLGSYALSTLAAQVSGPVLKEPSVTSTTWTYDVVALLNGTEVGRLDPRVIIRK